MRFFRTLLDSNIRWSAWLDRNFLSTEYLLDGNQDFVHNMVSSYVSPGMTVYDVGGGKRPFFSAQRKKDLQLFVVGLDIAENELSAAPDGCYDDVVCADISAVRGRGDGDLVICQAVLEHVADTASAISSISSLLKPGGTALIFVPSRNAIFARLNLLLPESLKKAILFGVFPSARVGQGFPSFYNHCTPRELLALCRRNDLELHEARYYFTSSYFSFFVPLHVAWRMWVILFKVFYQEQAAETFSLAVRKREVT